MDLHNQYTTLQVVSQVINNSILSSQTDETPYQSSELGLYLPQNNLGAEENESPPTTTKKRKAKKDQKRSARERLDPDVYRANYAAAKKRYKKLVKDLTLTDDEVVEIFWAEWAEYPIDAMKLSPSKRKRKTADTLEKSMGRLLGIVDDATRYNLHASHLDLDPACENPILYFKKDNIKRWRDAIELYVPLPYYCKLQVGWHFGGNRIHPHIISSKPKGKLASIESERVVKKMYEAEGFVEYVQELGLPWNKRNLKIRVGADRERNARRLETGSMVQVPRTAWFSKGLPNARTWGKA